ncbi:Cloroperoxidase [Amniculicola lignicola CBS 123094]|uniref:Cloroperoxidase n=1 Tax=Amniculicola lignicola CBS 123094 TaxID=1392246 RepID=A0A6A5WAS7_9PLEO|nr:Cloroperoxidase [Amniculicola lignicola CBS 123094]
MRLPLMSAFTACLLLISTASSLTFDPNSQRVNVTGQHKFIQAGPNDYRGPCPGLNALANHGYIPRNGVATIDQMINASTEVFGLSIDHASSAAIYSTPMTVSPDLNTISIGDPLKVLFDIPFGDIKTKISPQGLNFPHNSVEFDASPTRLDKYQPGSNGNPNDLHLPLFQQLFDLQKGLPDNDVNFSIFILSDHRRRRHLDSIAKNPLYFLPPFQGLFQNGVKYSLISQMFANRSAERSEGRLDRNTLMSFYGIEYASPDKKSLKYTKGGERIPDIWYRRARDDPYDLRKSNDDLLAQARRNPDLINKYSMGGNVAGLDSHRTIDIGQMTNNTYTRETIRSGYNLSCLAFMSTVSMAPRYLAGYYENVPGTVMARLYSKLPALVKDLGCEPLRGPIDERFFSSMFAGYNASLPGAPPVPRIGPGPLRQMGETSKQEAYAMASLRATG